MESDISGTDAIGLGAAMWLTGISYGRDLETDKEIYLYSLPGKRNLV